MILTRYLILFCQLAWSFSIRQLSFFPTPRVNSPLFNELTTSARWSALAYCPSFTIKRWMCGSLCSDKNSKLELISYQQQIISGSSVFIGYHNTTNTIVISYRGSRNIQNWANNLNIDLVGVDGWEGEVHEGFYSIYKALKLRILDNLKTLFKTEKYKDSKILLVGHSLGGALASYLSLDVIHLIENNFTNSSISVSLNTFGSPRVGNGKFSDYFYEKIFDYNAKQGVDNMSFYRVVNNHDIVPNLPNLNSGFVHIPHEVWYTSDGEDKSKKLFECNDLPYTNTIGKYSPFKEDPKCSYKTALWNWQDHLSFGNITFGMPCI